MDPNVDASWVEPPNESPNEPPNGPPKDDPEKPKRITRYIMHIIHIVIASILLAAVIADLIAPASSLFILYLLPTIALILLIEAHYVLRKVPRLSLRQSRLAPSSLQRRSFVYQVAGAFTFGLASADTVSHYPYWLVFVRQVEAIGTIVWAIGVVMYALFMLGKEYGFLDWVEEPQSEDEEEIGGEDGSKPAEVSEDSRGKRIARYLLHIVHLIIAILLVVFIIFNAISYASTFFTFYLLPLIVHVLIVETCYLLRRDSPQILRKSFIAPSKLRSRGFTYQLAGAYALAFSGQGSWFRYRPETKAAFGIATAVWISGVAIFALAIVGKEYDCVDWLEGPVVQGTIRLEDEETIHDQFRRPDSIRSELST